MIDPTLNPDASGPATQNEAGLSQSIKDFYLLEAAVLSEELDHRLTLAVAIIDHLQSRAKLDASELTAIEDIHNWIVQDLVNLKSKVPTSLIAGFINLGLEHGNRTWCILTSEFKTELQREFTNTIGELQARNGQISQFIQTRWSFENSLPWQADIKRNKLDFAKAAAKNDIEQAEEAWQILFTNTLNDPSEFYTYYKDLKKPLNLDAQVKFRIYLLTTALAIKSTNINIQNPVNIVRNHISKRTDSFQLVLLTNISQYLYELSTTQESNALLKSTVKTLDNISRLRRVDEVYLTTAAFYKILAAKYGINITKDIMHDHMFSQCQISENGRDSFLSPVLQMMLQYEPAVSPIKSGRLNMIKLKTGALLLVSKLALTVNKDVSSKNIEVLWHIIGDILEAYPADVSGLVHKMMQFAPTLHRYIPQRVHDIIQKRYLDGAIFSNINPESFITSYNNSTPAIRIKSFSRLPFAIGSIGQVFKGIASDGTELAIKIRKPGIEKSIVKQIRQAKPLEFLFKALNRNFNYLDLTEAMQSVFLSECDYEQEALHQKKFYELFKNHGSISVPPIYSAPNKDLIVQKFVEGMTFEEFIVSSNQSERNQVAGLIVEALLIQLKAGYFNYDIHPGNYLIGPNLSLILIDFGGVLSGEELSYCSPWEIINFIRNDDKAGLKSLLLKSGFYLESNLTNMDEKMSLFRSVYYRPFFTDGESEISDQFLREVMTNQLEIELKTGKAICSSTKTVTVMRFYWSFYSILARLNARLDFSAAFDRASKTRDLP